MKSEQKDGQLGCNKLFGVFNKRWLNWNGQKHLENQLIIWKKICFQTVQ